MIFDGKILNKKEEQEIKESVVEFENNTGAELVVGITHESDPYPGAVVRISIFLALFTTLLLSYVVEFAYPYFYILVQFLLTFLFLPLGRIKAIKGLALVDSEVEREVGEKAVEVFFTHCSEKASHSNEVLIYTSLFEKKIEILVGKNLKEKLSQETLNSVLAIIQEDFKQKQYANAYKRAIKELETKILEVFPDKVSSIEANELKNEVLWIKN